MPTVPPHVRLPIVGPSFACLNMYEKMSPSDALVSLISAAIGPLNTCCGYVPVAHVDDEALLADLRIEPLDELADAVAAHVGNVDIADLAAGLFLDIAAVVFDPAVVLEVRFARHRLDQHRARAFAAALRADAQF